MLKRLAIILACIFEMAVLSAQNVDRAVAHSVSDYFKNYKSSRTALKFPALDRRRNNIVVNNTEKRITIYSNEAFFGQAFTPGVVDTLYSDLRKLLPSKYRKFQIEVVYNGVPIDKCIPNIYRKEGVEEERLWQSLDYNGLPWVKNVSRPYGVKRGLEGRHIALWQSHGRYYFAEKDIWKWQRPPLYCTTEDLLTQSVVVPLLMPMLENAGALVYTPRERDWQPNCVIVDNDICEGASRYMERDGSGKSGKWAAYSTGYAPKEGVYVDKENPFAMGTSRTVQAVSGAKGDEIAAVWTPLLPVSGEYAVYVAYHTFKNSVPDAQYTVKHSGGNTVFHVNQKMGSGTWVYLGTFRFKAGDSSQGVVLSARSKYKGIVSADAVRFGGGTGNVARGDSIPQTSGLPRYLEAARYNLQTGGFPYEVYSVYEGENDYRDDVNCRSHAVNYLSGGSVYNPDTTGLNVPLELSFGFHSDAGFTKDDAIVGSLGVVTTKYNGDTLATGRSRYMSRDLVSYLLNNVQEDLTVRYGIRWPVRGILDRNYSESRLPLVPSVIFESLSHQNFMDMVYAHDPDFKFTLARSVYKTLLKHLCYVHGCEYVVQPLPVKDFHVTLSGDGKLATLRWTPVNDPQEPSAKASRYIVYTKIGDGGFDNGTIVDDRFCTMSVSKGVQYSFKVAALNDGGSSLPSEVLSLYVGENDSPRVLVVNGFHRLSGPQVVSTTSKAGFDMEYDPGVPFVRTPEYCGTQLDFLRDNIGYENGLGLSGNEYEGMLVAGNSFDYPVVHGKALAANGITFVSCSSTAVMEGMVELSGYDVVDLILGVEKQGGDGSYLGGYKRAYKTFPAELQAKLREYCSGGGSLFVSGAFMASDMVKNRKDKAFIRDVLRFDYGGSVNDLSESVISGSGLEFEIPRRVNEGCYTVSRPDILVPIDDAFVSFVFNGNRESAGVAYVGDYKVLSTSFPFEAVAGEKKRAKLMGAVMRFLK